MDDAGRCDNIGHHEPARHEGNHGHALEPPMAISSPSMWNTDLCATLQRGDVLAMDDLSTHKVLGLGTHLNPRGAALPIWPPLAGNSGTRPKRTTQALA